MAQESLDRQGAGELPPGPVDRPLCVQTLAAGAGYTLAIDTEGALFGWGNNSDGQLDATKKEWLIPGRLREGNDWVAVVAGRGAKWGIPREGCTSIAMNSSGDLKSLGLCDPLFTPPNYDYDPKGPNYPGPNKGPVPHPEPYLSTFASTLFYANTPSAHSIAATMDCGFIKIEPSHILAWPASEIVSKVGKYPLKAYYVLSYPGQFVAVFGAFDNFAAIATDGSLWTWGDNSCGQIGNGTKGGTVDRPTQIGVGTKWKEVAIGERHMLAMDEAGKVWAWGNNTKGQLGKSTNYALTPMKLGEDICKSIAAGANHSLMVSEDGFLFAWGANTHGQLGKSPDDGVYDRPQVVPETGNNWSKVYAGPNCCFAVQNGGTLYSWGENTSAQLGHGDKNTRYIPMLVKRPWS